MNTLLDVIDHAEKNGSESYNAPHCPSCGTGEDRLVIWPESGDTGKVWCRRCHWKEDGIGYVRKERGMSFGQACEFFGVEKEVSRDSTAESEHDTAPERPTMAVDAPHEDTPTINWSLYEAPSDDWRSAAKAFCEECKDRLWSSSGAAQSAREYLHGRGLMNETINAAGLGVNQKDRWPTREEWGLKGEGKVWLPRGVVIPWGDSEGVSGVNIRRPNGDIEPDSKDEWKQRKYQRAAGPSAPLYGVQWIDERMPIVLVEGEFDALAVQQEAADICYPVATGSTGGARRRRWGKLLANAPVVLVAFDAEEPGENAARAWISALLNGIRWRPHATDTSEMLEEGMDLRTWVQCGIQAAQYSLEKK